MQVVHPCPPIPTATRTVYTTRFQPVLTTALHAPAPLPAAASRRRNASTHAAAVASTVLAPLQSLTSLISRIKHDPQSTDPEALAVAAGVQRLVRCGPTPLGRGLVAKQPLERQTLVSVPLENALVLTDEPLSGISVFGDRWQERWQERHGRMPQQLQDFLTGEARWDVRMSAWLLWVARELRGSPVWGPYLANLPPAEEVTCLLSYGLDDARELQVPELVEEAKTQHNWAAGVHRVYFDSARGELRQLQLVRDVSDTLWAMAMVRTRTFAEDVSGEGLTLMVPYADLANHSFRFNSTFCLAPDQARFELRLLSSLAPGEEATISYGENKTNAEVMRDYGFVVPGNPNDRLPPLPPSTTSAGDAAAEAPPLPALNGASLMDSIGFKGDWREGTAAPKRPTLEAAEGDVQARLVLARRRCVLLSLKLSDGLPPAQGSGFFAGWLPSKPSTSTDGGDPPPQPLRMSAVPAERANVDIVRQSYQAALDALPTSIEKDEALLATTAAAHQHSHVFEDSFQEDIQQRLPLSCRTVGAVRYRLEHKLLLREAVRVLDEYDRWLAARQANHRHNHNQQHR